MELKWLFVLTIMQKSLRVDLDTAYTALKVAVKDMYYASTFGKN